MRRTWLAVLALVLLAWTAVPSYAAPAEDPTDDPTAGAPAAELDVAITGIEPMILRPGDDLVVTGTLTNATPEEIAEPELRLRVQQRTPISRSMLTRWLDPESFAATSLLLVETLDDPLPAEESVPFTLEVPADQLPMEVSYIAGGPRGLEVAATDLADPVAPAATARNYLLWWPEVPVATMPLAVLGTATPTTAERTAAQTEDISVAAAAAPRLAPLLEALDQPQTDIAVDPALLSDPPADVDLTTDTEAAPRKPNVPQDVVRLRRLLTSLAQAPARALHALPWADADTAALTHAGRTDLRDDGAELTRQALQRRDLDGAVDRDLFLPATEPDAVTLESAVGDGAEAVVLPSSALDVVAQLTYTPSGRVQVPVGEEEVPAVVVEERLSSLLAGEHLPFATAEDTAVTQLDPLTARQLLLAETAVIARERPTDRRDLVLALPRDFAGDPAALADRLEALAQAPWLARTDLTEVLTHEAPTELERVPLPRTTVAEGEVSAGELDRLSEVVARTGAFASMLTDPAALVTPVRTRLMEATSVAWREAPAIRTSLVEEAEAAADARSGLVAARPGSTLNLINDEAHIPVAVSNDMAHDAHVEVRLEPRDARLVAPDTVPLEISADQTATAQVPVRAIGSGDVVVDVVLTSPAGDPVATPTEIQVRVRAGWETVGTAIVAGLLVVMLVVGLVRTVRRARSARHQPSHARGENA